ncbi:MAG TPA: sigma-70 family RNA polymerase sigma factor [Cytophagaceae bacterium]
MKIEDKDILKAIRSGEDHKALEALYKYLLPHIYKLVNVGKDKEEEAKDILQEAMLIFYKQVINNKFDESYSNGIRGFIYSVARNLWINQTKKNKKFIDLNYQSIENIKDTNILDELEIKEKNQLIENIFSRLGDKCRELLRLSIFEELSMKEVAEKTGYPNPNAATVAAHRCKKSLLEILKKYKSANTITP